MTERRARRVISWSISACDRDLIRACLTGWQRRNDVFESKPHRLLLPGIDVGTLTEDVNVGRRAGGWFGMPERGGGVLVSGAPMECF